VFNEVFKMSDLEKTWIIVDFKIIKDRNKYTLMLNQISYIIKVLLEEKIKNYLHIKIFMKSESFITLNKMNNVMKANSVNMQWIVEKLIYIACNTQLDIIFMIKCLSQNFLNVQIKYIKAARWVMWYLKKTISYELRYKSIMNICTN